MKIKSIILSALSTVIFTSSVLFVHVSAEDMTILSSNEISEIISAVESENAAVSNDVVYSVNTNDSGNKFSIDLSIKNYEVEKSYKLYTLKNLMITEYKNNPDFKSLIMEGERIMLPAEGKLVTLMEKDSVYKVIGTQYTDEIFDFNTLTEGIISNINEEIVNIVHTYSFMYYMDIIYIETAENEYAVPYFNNNKDYSLGDRLISGTIYSVPEFMDRMDQTFDEEYLINHGDEDGGVPVKAYSPYVPSFTETASAKDHLHNFAVIISAIAAVAFIAFLAVFLILNRNKHINKKPEN